MKKLNKRERIMGAMIAVCVPLVYLSVVYTSQAEKIQTLQTSLQTESSKLQSQEAILTDLTAKAILAKKASDSNDEIKRYLETNRYMSNLLRKLGADEQERGMILKNIAVQDNKKLNNFYQSTMKVEVESSFVALGNFLGALSDTETLIDVKTVVLNRIDSDLKRCTAVIEVNGYFNEGPKL
jgi:Tfp pilus assembly protein PilO